jgi:hypothetical protein
VAGCVGVSDSEPNRDTIEETNLGRRLTLAGEVIAHKKNEFVLAGAKFGGDQQRLISPPVGIGSNGFEQRWLVGAKGPKFNLHARRGTAVGCVEDMGA